MTELSPTRVSFLLFPNVTQLDLTGPAQVLSRLGNATIDLVAKTRDPVATDAGFDLLPTATFADAAQPDILCVPGGVGDQAVMEDEETLAWVREAAVGAQWVTSVCTGALILGAAGLLKGIARPRTGPRTSILRPSARSRCTSGSSSTAIASPVAE